MGVRVIECVLVQDRALRAQSSIVDRHLATGDGRARVGANDRSRCARAIGGAFARVDASNRARDEEMRAGGRRCGIMVKEFQPWVKNAEEANKCYEYMKRTYECEFSLTKAREVMASLRRSTPSYQRRRARFDFQRRGRDFCTCWNGVASVDDTLPSACIILVTLWSIYASNE